MMHSLPLSQIGIALASFVVTVALLAGWLHRGTGERLLARPNVRSSHKRPVPTGGGLVGVLVLICVLAGYFFAGVTWAGWLAGGGLVIAGLGFADDLWELSARLRLSVQVLVVAVLVWSADAVGRSQFGWSGMLPAPLLGALWVLAIVWFINLFNFMDGIDGLATLQSGSYCLAALLFITGDAGWYTGVLWAGLAASLGFAVFNVAPARIFMGDVGSEFWGLLLAMLALQLAISGALPLVASLILLSAFWFDATYTLCVRITTGQPFTEGHRSHLYQRLTDRWGHGRTSAGYLAFMLLWQWPLTGWFMAGYLPLNSELTTYLQPSGLALQGGWFVALACVPLALGCIGLRAGSVESQRAP